MPTLDPLGATVPVPSDPADLPRWVRTLNLTAPPIVEVSSTTQANSMRAAYQDACVAAGVTPKRLFVWNTSNDNLERATASSWEYVAGRQHGATVVMSTANLRAGQNDVVHPSSFTRASTGWAIASDGHNVIVPSTGMYLFDLSGSIAGDAGTLGRTYSQFRINNATLKGRQGFTNEDIIHTAWLYPLSKGDQVKVEIYHAGGGTRTFAGEMNIAQINSPNW